MLKRNGINFIFYLILMVFVFGLIVSPLQSSPEAKKESKKLSQKELIKRLPKKYKDWLDLVHYIITPQEKKVFLQLTNNKDRDVFIKLFWQMRDPTPGTPENEFKEEHIKRFKYANKRFKTGRPGWMTDMGKIYIILGPPNTREYYDNQFGLYPTIVWGYYGKREWGLPAYFYVVFYKRNGIGEYVLYDPAFDGPYSLLRDVEGLDIYNPYEIYKRLKEISPTIVKPAFSLIPGEESYMFMPSPRNTQLLMKIIELPKKRVKVSYAEHFLKYKGVVEVDYSMGYIESQFLYRIVRDQLTGLQFIHFAIKPKSISIAYSEAKDKYYFAFKVNVSIKKGENIIYQTTKNYSFYFTEEEVVKKLRPFGLSIEYMFPVVSGDYQLNVLIQNSIKKEFSYIEKKIHIPSPSISKVLKPLATYKVKKINPELFFRPFKFFDMVAFVDPSNEFAVNDNKYIITGICGEKDNIISGKLKIVVKSKPGYTPYKKVYEKVVNLEDYKKNCSFFKVKLDENLPPASYNVTSSFYKNGIPVDTEKSSFIVSPLSTVSHPMEAYRIVDSKNRGIFYVYVADEYRNLGQLEKASEFYKKSIESGFIVKENLTSYAKTLILLEKYDEVLKVADKLKNIKDSEFEYYSILGEAYFYLEEYDKALSNLLKANKIYDSDYRVVNLLGMTFYQKRMYKEALKAFEASLKLNPEQDTVKGWVKKLKDIINKQNTKSNKGSSGSSKDKKQ